MLHKNLMINSQLNALSDGSPSLLSPVMSKLLKGRHTSKGTDEMDQEKCEMCDNAAHKSNIGTGGFAVARPLTLFINRGIP